MNLLDRIDQLLSNRESMAEPKDLVAGVSARWRDVPNVDIDTNAATRQDDRGSWVCAWLLAQPACPPIDRERFRDALDSLPLLAREVYRLHRIEGKSLAETGRQLGLDPAATEAQLFEALRGLHERLYPLR